MESSQVSCNVLTVACKKILMLNAFYSDLTLQIRAENLLDPMSRLVGGGYGHYWSMSWSKPKKCSAHIKLSSIRSGKHTKIKRMQCVTLEKTNSNKEETLFRYMSNNNDCIFDGKYSVLRPFCHIFTIISTNSYRQNYVVCINKFVKIGLGL